MTDQEQDIAVALSLGWRHLVLEKDENLPGRYGVAIDQWVHPSGSLTVPIPKYGQCLNAMHEAENALTDFQWFDYDLHLEVITKCDEIIQRKRINATASQRREAYLRTLNLYVE